jgi:hypothetical protein
LEEIWHDMTYVVGVELSYATLGSAKICLAIEQAVMIGISFFSADDDDASTAALRAYRRNIRPFLLSSSQLPNPLVQRQCVHRY